MKITRTNPERPLDQQFPDYKEETLTDVISYPFDFIATVDDDGDVSYEFEGFGHNIDDSWGNWYSKSYPGVEIATADEVADKIDQMLVNSDEAELLDIPGQYQVSGTAYIQISTELGYYADVDVDDISNSTADVESRIDEANSYIEELSITPVAQSVTSATELNDSNTDYDVIYAADDAVEGDVVDDDIDAVVRKKQKYTSKNTAVNAKYGRTPELFGTLVRKFHITSGLVLDYGGGTEAAKLLGEAWWAEHAPDVEYVYYDKYWQPASEQNEAFKRIRDNGGADVAMLSNVLNVIEEPEIRHDVLEHVKGLLKPNGTLYILGYEGQTKDRGQGGRSTAEDQYQTFMLTNEYIPEILEVFPDVQKRYGVLYCVNNDAVTL